MALHKFGNNKKIFYEEPWQKDRYLRYLPPQTGDFEGHVSHPLRDGTQTELGREALSRDAEAEGAAVMKFPP